MNAVSQGGQVQCTNCTGSFAANKDSMECIYSHKNDLVNGSEIYKQITIPQTVQPSLKHMWHGNIIVNHNSNANEFSKKNDYCQRQNFLNGKKAAILTFPSIPMNGNDEDGERCHSNKNIFAMRP